MKAISFVTAALMWLSMPFQAHADLEDVLIDDGWDEIVFDDKSPNIFTANDSATGLGREIKLTSEATVSIAFLNVDIDLEKTPSLAWSWMSETPIIDTDTTIKGGDDRSLAIYVAFPYQPDQAGFSDKLRRATIEVLKGPDTPDRILTYMWGGGAERGTRLENPYTGENGQIIYLRTPEDASGMWFEENVDVRADFIKAFGFAPVSPVYVGIGGDSDDTLSVIKARVRGLAFTQ